MRLCPHAIPMPTEKDRRRYLKKVEKIKKAPEPDRATIEAILKRAYPCPLCPKP